MQSMKLSQASADQLHARSTTTFRMPIRWQIAPVPPALDDAETRIDASTTDLCGPNTGTAAPSGYIVITAKSLSLAAIRAGQPAPCRRLSERPDQSGKQTSASAHGPGQDLAEICRKRHGECVDISVANGPVTSNEVRMPTNPLGALISLSLCLGTLTLISEGAATAGTSTPSSSLERALSDISPTDWSVQSSAQLVQRVLARATQADLDAAAAQGAPQAETILAMARDFALGGYPEDKTEAVRLYTLAANQGFAAAQEYLAGHYELGHGVPRDIDAAIRLHSLAANQGYPRAQINLGFLYMQGAVVAPDYTEAMQLFRSAADGGNQHGMRNVGYMYEHGLGVPQDLAQAIYWYRKAARLGFAPAQADLRRLGVADL